MKFTLISSEKSLVDVLTLMKQFDGVLPTLEVIKLSKACIAGCCYFI